MKSMTYDYEDIWFQLELNLQNIRREIIKLLEEYQFNDCFECNRLKCCCSDESSFQSTTLSIATASSGYFNLHELSMGMLYITAPPATSLPTPEWTKNTPCYGHQNQEESNFSVAEINSWIQASIPHINLPNARLIFPVPAEVLNQINYSWPPFPSSIWSDEKRNKTTIRENRINDEKKGRLLKSVEEFFSNFSKNTAAPKAATALLVQAKWM